MSAGMHTGAGARAASWQELPAPAVELADLLDGWVGTPVGGPPGGAGRSAAPEPPVADRPPPDRRAPDRRAPERALRDLLDRVPGAGQLPDAAAAAAERAVVALATPPGALGHLGALTATLSGIAGRCPPAVPARPAVVVAVGDHGVHAQQVSPWPQSISATVAQLVAEGRAGASPLAAVAGARTVVVDVGLSTPVGRHPRLVPARVVEGTRDATQHDALTVEEVVRAILVGARVTTALLDEGCDLLVLGDVGIGNTTTSAALIAANTGADPGEVTGRGSGIDDATLARKREVVGLLAHRARGCAPLEQLAATGGAEHAAMVGIMLAAAAQRVPVLLDGVVTDAAALVAARLTPQIAGLLLAGHLSPEPAAQVALEALGLRPLLDLELRLGEGSGALLAVPVVISAARLLHEVATLDEVVG